MQRTAGRRPCFSKGVLRHHGTYWPGCLPLRFSYLLHPQSSILHSQRSTCPALHNATIPRGARLWSAQCSTTMRWRGKEVSHKTHRLAVEFAERRFKSTSKATRPPLEIKAKRLLLLGDADLDQTVQNVGSDDTSSKAGLDGGKPQGSLKAVGWGER